MVNTYICFLRGINVSGQKIIKMADLKKHFGEWGLNNVKTYIQSGNIVFTSESSDNFEQELIIKNGIKQDFGFDVEVIVLKSGRLVEILDKCPYLIQENPKALYFTFLSTSPSINNIKELSNIKDINDELTIMDNVIYLHCSDGYGKTKLNNNFLEKRLKVSTTTRNLYTVKKMIEISHENQ